MLSGSPTSTVDQGTATAAPPALATSAAGSAAVVTLRAFVLGLLLTIGIAWVNSWMATVHSVHMVGGIQMPFGSIFVLFLFSLVNLLVRYIDRALPLPGPLRPLTAAELLTVYSMMLFGSLLSTPGSDNQFLATGPGLFYLASRENRWAEIFFKHVPTWFAPSWDGRRYDNQTIERLFVGDLTWQEIPWQHWTATIMGWSIFLLLCYSLLFFVALIFRRQWTEYEALAFPLVELPVQMVRQEEGRKERSFWSNPLTWVAFGLAFFIHSLKGLNTHFPDWPVFPVNQFGGVRIEFTEKPWNAVPYFTTEIYLGGIGLAYLLTREVSFSFWFFYLIMALEHVGAEMLGFPVGALPRSGLMNRPAFIIYQGVGGWVMMALLLVWMGRLHLLYLWREALSTNRRGEEPFTPRFMFTGLFLSAIGLLGWTTISGVSPLYAVTFICIYLLTSLILTRMVIEGGFMFPQPPFLTLQWMSEGMFSASAIGAANYTRLAFMQSVVLVDTRTNVLPAFLHAMKIAEILRMDRRNLRRLLACVTVAVVVSLATTIVVTIYAMYWHGGLNGYTWFTRDAADAIFKEAQGALTTGRPVDPLNFAWMGVGAAVVLALTVARSRLPWFALHPLGYLMAPAYPITRLWFAFFIGWLIKTLIMKYGGSDAYSAARPFMIGLILGNVMAMMLWMTIAFFTGHQISYWPA